jgi:TolB protein
MRPLTALLLVLACLAAPLIQAQDTTIIVPKGVRTANPKLYLESFSGDEQARARLLADLKYADWFDLVGSAAGADYRLHATITRGDGAQAELRLLDSAGNQVVGFRQRATGSLDLLVHHTVNQLIQQTFKNPGPCTARLAYVQRTGDVREIWTADFDGSNAKQLTHNRSMSVEPAWRVDGKYLLYTLYDRYSTSIAEVDLTGRVHRRLSSSRGLNSGAAYSPDGRQIALTLSKDGNVELYLMNRADLSLKRLTRTAGVEASPTWSPDGARLCFTSDFATTRPTLYLMSAGGGNVTRLLSVPTEAVAPDWSPVSDRIVFSMRMGSDYTLAMVDMKQPGAGPQVLVSAGGDWESPSWAPDGRHVVCAHGQGNSRQLYIVDTWYGKLLPLTSPGTAATLPCYTGR